MTLKSKTFIAQRSIATIDESGKEIVSRPGTLSGSKVSFT